MRPRGPDARAGAPPKRLRGRGAAVAGASVLGAAACLSVAPALHAQGRETKGPPPVQSTARPVEAEPPGAPPAAQQPSQPEVPERPAEAPPSPEGPPGSAAPPPRGYTAPKLLAPLKLKGSSAGDASVEAGIGVLWPMGADWDGSAILNVSVESRDGLASLLGIEKGGVTPPIGRVGLTFSLARLEAPSTDVLEGRTTEALDVRRRAVAVCEALCVEPRAEQNEAFCKHLEQRKKRFSGTDLVQRVAVQKLCPAGLEAFQAYERRFRRRFPQVMIDVGGNVGVASFEYLVPEGDPPLLQPHEDRETPWSAGLSFMALPTRGARSMSFEGIATYRSDWEASGSTARWCVPAGSVPREGDDASRAPPDPAETCKEQTLGAPENPKRLHLGLFLGVVDEASGFWRAAIGPDFLVPLTDAGVEEFAIGARLPVYVTLARAPEDVFEYRGVLRLTPSFTVTRLRDGDKDIRGGIELSLLGERTLFSPKFDEL